MDATTLSIIERITERYQEPKLVFGGHKLKVFYNCSLLNMAELSRLAAAALGDGPRQEFDVVVGLAYRGILFAGALAHGKEVAVLQLDSEICGPSITGRRVLVVDDVMHSGGRIIIATELVEKHGGKVVAAACIVDRSVGISTELSFPVYSAFKTDFS